MAKIIKLTKRPEIIQKALLLLVAHNQKFGSTTQANALAHQEVWLHRKDLGHF
jgi:hypothetical protein